MIENNNIRQKETLISLSISFNVGDMIQLLIILNCSLDQFIDTVLC